VTLGAGEDDIDASACQQIAQLCISAGADMAAIERWMDEGRRRAARARQIPSGRPGRPGRAPWQ